MKIMRCQIVPQSPPETNLPQALFALAGDFPSKLQANRACWLCDSLEHVLCG
jgi:hypothetical protein